MKDVVTINCKSCKNKCNYYSRYCDICGEPLYIPLEQCNLDEYEFIDVYNSVFSFLIYKKNSKREIYFPKKAIDVIDKRVKEYYKDISKSIRPNLSTKHNLFYQELNALTELAAGASTNMISGYSLRVTEELITNRKIDKISSDKLNLILEKIMNNYKDESTFEINSDLEGLCYSFCNNVEDITKYYLTEPDKINKWFDDLVFQNLEYTIKLYRDLLKIYNDEELEINKFIEKNYQIYYDGVWKDLLFGYCLKTSLELIPS